MAQDASDLLSESLATPLGEVIAKAMCCPPQVRA